MSEQNRISKVFLILIIRLRLWYVYCKVLLRYYREILSFPRTSPIEYDVVFVAPEAGWILDGICKEIDKYYQGKTKFVYSANSLPYAKAYFFAHYSLLKPAIFSNPHIVGSKIAIYHTHPRDIGQSTEELIYFLKHGLYVAFCL